MTERGERKVTCAVCHTIFAPRSPNHRYCKEECKAEGLRRAIQRQKDRRREEREGR